jgi:hypothetical protein
LFYLSSNQLKLIKMIGKIVIVRSDKAGVFFGTLKSKEGSEVVMTNVRKIWYWDGASAVEQLASEGVTKANNCKFTVTVNEICILGVSQIIPCTEFAIKLINNVKEWKQ